MKAVIFDIDDTLYDQLEPFRTAYEEVFGGRFEIDMQGLFAARSRRSNEVFEAAMAGEISMDEMFIYRGQKAFADMGVEITPQEALDFQHAYERSQERITLSDTMKEVLEVCKNAGFLLGILTNGPAQHQRKKVQILGTDRWISPQHVIISAECGVSKPDAAIFRCAQEKLGVSAGDCIFIGDSFENDIIGAKRAGWQAVWLNKLRRNVSDGTHRPDHTVYDEAELAAWIRDELIGGTIR